MSSNTTRRFNPLPFLLGVFVIVLPVCARADIIADGSAPSSQRPTVLQAGNGVPLVNIRTPSEAGVSRNAYSEFNVYQRGDSQ